MPWTKDDAETHTKKARTEAQKELWARVANSELAHHGDEGRAIRVADSVIAREAAKE